VSRDRSRAPHWAVEIDSSAPSKPNVLKQTAAVRFRCVKKAVSIADGFAEVKFNRWPGAKIRPADSCGAGDGDNYYIARANALEGKRLALSHRGASMDDKYVDAPVTATNGTALRVEFC